MCTCTAVHARNRDRLTAMRDLLDRGAAALVGDLSDLEETRGLASNVNRLDAVIHHAGVDTGPQVLTVNVVAPYLLTALIDRPQRLVHLSSSEHRSGCGITCSRTWLLHRYAPRLIVAASPCLEL